MVCYPKNSDELGLFLTKQVTPTEARRVLAQIFICLYGTTDADATVSFDTEKPWECETVCQVADELSTLGLYCDQPNRE